jgi:nitrous oxide reductase accessory protein NosL
VSGRVLVALALLAAVAGPVPARTVLAAEPAPAASTFSCAECGMTGEMAGRFTSRLVSDGATQYFCDIGDLVAFIGRTHPKEFSAAVRDLPSGEWLDAGAAFFVIDKKAYATPMGWGVAAFRDRPAAGTALDFQALRKALQ